ncbi:unnamed protein product [Ceutorhynchus assimilis]|uniref:Odorant receptor n=1 Tax=Ceutorhynchus assimilis TaxID=467358 RepID=A0A9P0DDH2_9CUCU|nr:unnamed protein product [Ceutorhynchus assimilis]
MGTAGTMSNQENNQQLIGWSKIVMINTGFWKQPISESKSVQLCFEVYSVLVKLGYILLWILLTAEIIRMFLNDYPDQIKFQALGAGFSATLMGMKMLIYQKYDIMEMINDVIEKEKEVWGSTSEEIHNVYRVKIRVCKAYVLIIGGFLAGGFSYFQISGAFAMVELKHQNLINNQTIEPNFMYLTLFPRDRLSNLYITFGLQAIWSWVGYNFGTMTHVVFLTLLTYSASQLEILQVKLKNFIGPDDFIADVSDAQYNEKISVLKNLIEDHKYIIGFVEHLNDCTKYIILMEYCLNSLNIASVSLNIIKMELSLSEIVWRLSFVIQLCAQVFILGWSCNEVKVQSETVADALYDSRWHLLNKEGKQLVQIMIARAQRPLTLTIGDFGPMTNDSSVLIVKAAYSYVSLFS